MRKLVIIGAGGHGKVVLEIAKTMVIYDEIVFLDDKNVGKYVMNQLIVGQVSSYRAMDTQGIELIVAIGDNNTRLTLLEEIMNKGYIVPILKHPSAVVSQSATVGRGTVIMPNAIINAQAHIGQGVIVNTGAIVEHDCKVADGVHLSPRSTLGGGVSIGEKTWLGIGAMVKHQLTIEKDITIGMGAVVTKSIKESGIYVGIPAKKMGEM